MNSLIKPIVTLTCILLFSSIGYTSGNDNLKYCLVEDRDRYLEIKAGIDIEIEKEIVYPTPDKIAYLTFDDGPTVNITTRVLDILKEHNIRATFFTIGRLMEKNPDIVRRIKSDGHSLGNHSYSHNYNTVYSDLAGFEAELQGWNSIAKSILGDHYETTLFRFPGGSHNKSSTYKDYLVKSGYRFYDWNALNGDSEENAPSKSYLMNRTKQTVKNQSELIFLMHDASGKATTVDTLADVIHLLRMKGYEFRSMEEILEVKELEEE